MRGRVLLAVTALVLLSLPVAAQEPPGGPAASLELEPTAIPVDVFHNGARLRVQGEVPVGYEIAVVCRGVDDTVELTKKGKLLGLLWMNVGEATLEHVPALYQVNTVHSLKEIAPPDVRRALGVGYDALEARVTSDQEAGEQSRLFGELIKLKEREGLFATREHAVQRTDHGAGQAAIATTFTIPARAPFGSYEVVLFGFRDGVGRKLATAQVGVHPVGLVAFMSSLARNHGLAFGLLAVGVAIAMGLLTGVIFGRGSKKVH